MSGAEPAAGGTVAYDSRCWPLLASRELLDVGLFKVSCTRSRSPRTGEECDFHLITMPDWLLAVPMTPDGRLVMVRQFRHGSGMRGLEFPGGLLEAGRESPEAGVLRELAEETGYGGGRLRPLGALWAQPAVLAVRARYYAVLGVAPLQAPQPDPGEDIEVVLVEPRALPGLIDSGAIHNAMSVAAMALAWMAGHLGAPVSRRPTP